MIAKILSMADTGSTGLTMTESGAGKAVLSYEHSLWNGFTSVVERVERTIGMASNLGTYMGRRADAERDYASKLNNASAGLSNLEISGLLPNSWTETLQRDAEEAAWHSTYADWLHAEVSLPALKLATTASLRIKTITKDGTEVLNRYASASAAHAKAKRAYEDSRRRQEESQAEFDRLSINLSQLDPSKMKSAGKRVVKDGQTAEKADEVYKKSLRTLRDAELDYYEAKIPVLLHELQLMHEEVIQALRALILAVAENQARLLPLLEASGARLVAAVAPVSFLDEIESTIAALSTGEPLPEFSVYEPWNSSLGRCAVESVSTKTKERFRNSDADLRTAPAARPQMARPERASLLLAPGTLPSVESPPSSGSGLHATKPSSGEVSKSSKKGKNAAGSTPKSRKSRAAKEKSTAPDDGSSLEIVKVTAKKKKSVKAKKRSSPELEQPPSIKLDSAQDSIPLNDSTQEANQIPEFSNIPPNLAPPPDLSIPDFSIKQVEKDEEERLQKEKEAFEKERIEKENARVERERIERDRIEKERLAKERLEKERLEKESLEKERVEKERVEKERVEKERVEKERVEKERVEKERVEKERIEKEKKMSASKPKRSLPIPQNAVTEASNRKEIEVREKSNLNSSTNSLSGGKPIAYARALHTRNSNEPNQLSFPKGALISILKKPSGSWWFGAYEDKAGYLPAQNWIVELSDAELQMYRNSQPASDQPKHSATPAAQPTRKPQASPVPKSVSVAVQAAAPGRSSTLRNPGANAKIDSVSSGTAASAPINGASTASNPPGYLRCRALFDFDPENSQELALKVGDIVVVEHRIGQSSWFRGTNQRTGEVGRFPSDWVARVD